MRHFCPVVAGGFFFCLSSSVFAATAVDDFYLADNIFLGPGGECNSPPRGDRYELLPSIFQNDTITNPQNINSAAVTFSNINIPGVFFFMDGSSPPRVGIDTSCSSGPLFTIPLTADYTYNDGTGITTGRITVQPPGSTQPLALDDIYDGDNLSVQVGPGTGQYTYTLNPTPLANDTLAPPYDEAQTINATDNFLMFPGGNAGTFNAFIGSSGPTFQFISDGQFLTQVNVAYNLLDPSGGITSATTGFIIISPPTPPAITADTYNADTLSTVTDAQGNVGYRLNPSPFANDTITAIVDTQQTTFNLVSGNGTLIRNGSNYDFFPGTSSSTTFNYHLFDAQGNQLTQTAATITITGPTPPSVANDAYDADTLTTVIDGQGNIGYRVIPDPFANDSITAQVNFAQTIVEPGNFSNTSGDGTLQIVAGAGLPEFTFFPGTALSNTFSYHLYDIQGNQLTQSPATITITGPTPSASSVDDVYNADNAAEIQVIQGSPGTPLTYRLLNSPFANDTLNPPADEAGSRDATGNFSPASGTTGVLSVVSAPGVVLDYNPGATGFTQPAVFNYFLADAQGVPIAGTDATITINPPPAPTVTDDNYNAAALPQVPDPQGTGYQLVPNPFANDALTQAVDIDRTVNPQQNNFVRTVGDGNLQIIAGQSGPEFNYFPGSSGTSSFTYHLYDVQGNQLTQAPAIITVTDPAASTTVDDVYNADDPSQVEVVQQSPTNTIYRLLISPFANDTVNTPADINASRDAPGNFSPAQGTVGTLTVAGTSGVVLEYNPGASGFTQPAIFNYFLTDSSGNFIANTNAIITINPPAQPAPNAVSDNYDANDLTQVVDSTSGAIGYRLEPIPFDNDVLSPPYDEQGTITASGNFVLDSGTGSLQIVQTQTGLEFNYYPGQTFDQVAVFTYFLADAQGSSISTSNGTITISPPTLAQPTTSDDVINSNDIELMAGPAPNETTYRLNANPLGNDNLAPPYDEAQTLQAGDNFTVTSGTGRIVVTTGPNGQVFELISSEPFTSAIMVTYALYDAQGNVIPNTEATITINPPGGGQMAVPPEPERLDNIEEACEAERTIYQRLPAICDNSQVTPSERLLLLSTINAQADTLFGMQSDQIANVRQRMSENRSVYNPASVSNLNATILGKQVPVGRIAQELMQPLSGGGAADDDFINSGRLGVFINGSFTVGDRDETALSSGFDSDGYNLTSGVDYRVNLNLIVGAALGLANEDTSFAANRGEQGANTTSLSFYGNYFPANAVYADWLLMLTKGDLDISRNSGVLDQFAKAETDGSLWSFAGTLGYHWNANAWEIDAYSRVEYTDLQIDGYRESGSFFDLTVYDQQAESLEAGLGFKLARVFSLANGVVIPSLDLEWLNQFEDDTRFIAVDMENVTSGFLVADEGSDSNYFNGALSLSSVFASGFSGYVRIETLFGDDHLGRTQYSGGLRWEF